MKPPIAVLVDGDQLGPEAMQGLMDDLGKQWTVSERICVRNWRSTRDQQAWREFAATHAFRLIQRDPVAAGKNASDIELAVIAMDLLAAGHRSFSLVSGDMDFTPLVDRLRRGGCHVEWIRPADLRARPKPAARAGAGQGRKKAAQPAKRAGGATGKQKQAPSPSSPVRRAPSPPAPSPTAARPARAPANAAASRPAKASGARGGGRGAAAAPDKEGFAKAVRRVVAELRRAGEHERGWVSVNRLGGRLTEAGTTKDDFGFPKRRPLWEALQEAGFTVEQLETGQYRVTIQ